jgi:hypothetical protein
MKVLWIIAMIFISSCASKPEKIVDPNAWYDTSKNGEYFSIISSKLSGKHHAILNLHRKENDLLVSITVPEAHLVYKIGEEIRVIFDNLSPQMFYVIKTPVEGNVIYLAPANHFVQYLSSTKTMQVSLKISNAGLRVFTWEVAGLKEIFYKDLPMEAIEI